MRQETNDGVTLTYPDDIGFAFNPCLLMASGDKLARMSVTVNSGEKKETIWLDAMAGRCYADVREYVQSLFDDMDFGVVDYERESKAELGKRVSFAIGVTKDGDGGAAVSFSFDVFYVWGAMKTGGQEIYNGCRTLAWFRGFPFTVGVYAVGGGSVMFCKDGVPDRLVNIPEQGVWNIPMRNTDDARRYYLLSDGAGACGEVTFDDTFDMTFRYVNGNAMAEKIRIDIVDGHDGGYYLRWIDRHGFYRYYLFKSGDEARKVTSEDVFIRNNLMSCDMSFGYRGHDGRQQRMGREDTVPACAPLVDGETWDMLFDIATSPYVDLFVGYKDGKPRWLPVTVAPGSYTKTKAALQDFVCNIVMPEVPIQKL